jgi:4-hydroxy-tetrahydrodipicolinate synthase
MLATVIEEADGKVPTLAGIIATSTARALDQIRVSQRLGCKNIVVTPTFYIALQREAEILAHFAACRDATDQDLVIYNIPSCTGCHIPVSTMRTMTDAGWAVAIKESSGDAEYFRQLLAIGAETDLRVLQGNETDISWSLAEGAAGIVPVCANYDPAMFVEIYRDSMNGGSSRLAENQSRIDSLREALLVGGHNWVAGVTWGLHTLGIGNGIPPLPLQPVDDERKALIQGISLEQNNLEDTAIAQCATSKALQS